MAQITIDVNPNFKHTVGEVDSLNRKRMIKIHADTREGDWGGVNFENNTDLRDTFLNGLDVYMGRNTGGISWNFNQVAEDPNRPGFADPIDLANLGQNSRNNYANTPAIHPYEARNELTIAAQQHPFFPDGTPTQQGWAPANGTAVGEFMGRYVNEFHGGNGQPEPAFVEVMNEPLWELTTNGPITATEVFEFHNEVADAAKEQNPDLLIGGYTTAFPKFEVDNFQRWNDRWKLFMDMSGDKMDFWSIHLYDFSALWGGSYQLRKGSNMEATLDMMDHYSYLSFDDIKPYVISEYGGRALDSEHLPWTPLRDWKTLKAMSPMLMSFMERPQHILSAIPFITVKAEWGTQAGIPYPWRLMRKDNELPGQTGNFWVYTDMVKFYQLWSDVKGKRVDSESTDPDIQTNAFVDGDKLYLTIANLNFTDETVNLNVVENTSNPIQNIRVKHLHLNAAGDATALDEDNFTTLDNVLIGGEGAIVIEYTFENDLLLDQWVEEEKYFSNEHLTQIIGNGVQEFHINGVDFGAFGEASIRIGMGRPHGTSLTPNVQINGHAIEVPANYQGDDQLTRDSWFGIIEVDVPLAYLQSDNVVSVQYPDVGGHISSMALRIFNHSEPIIRSDAEAVAGIMLTPAFKQLEPTQAFTFIASILPITATNPSVVWTSSDEAVATVDDSGNVTALTLGQTTITATTVEGGFAASSTLEVVTMVPVVSVAGLVISPESTTLALGDLLQMQADISPSDATNQSVNWTSVDPAIASITASGVVQGLSNGTTEVVGTTVDGNYSDTSSITVESIFETFLICDLLPTEVESQTEYDLEIEYSVAEEFDIAIEFKNAIGNWVGEGHTTVSPGVGTTTITVKCISTVDWTTPVFPEPGTGYTFFAWVREVGGNWSTNMGGCATAGVTVNGDTDSVTPIELSDFALYPNPTDGMLFLDLPALESEATLTIFDVLGNTLLQSAVFQKRNQYDLNALPSGLYFVKVETEEGSVTKRIVVE